MDIKSELHPYPCLLIPRLMDLLPAYLSLTILTLLLILKIKTKNKNSIAENLPPSPPKLPIIGNLLQLGKIPHQNLCRLSHKYGPIMLLQLGKIPTLVVSSAEMAKEILQTHDAVFCSRPDSPGARSFFYNFSDIAFSCSDHWRERRKIYVSHLVNSKRSIKSFWAAQKAEVNHLVESISLNLDKPVNLDEKIYDLVDGVITTVAFGKSYRGRRFEGQGLKEVIDEAMEVINCFAAEDFFPCVGSFVDRITGHKRRLSKCFTKLDGYLQKVLDEHQNQSKPRDESGDFVDILIGISRDPSSVHLNNDHIKAILMNTFLGGVNSAAISIIWAMTELIKNPRVMKKVQAEIRKCIESEGKVICSEDLEKLAYFKMVVKETLRLHPPASLLLPHQSIRRCVIGGDNGYNIRAQTRVLINAWAIGRDPKTWENPNDFFPERFEKKNEGVDFRGRNFELLPFGAGRRYCPGVDMAIGVIELTLANLLCLFDWEVPVGTKVDDISFKEKTGITTHKETPLYLVPISRI